MIFPKWPTIFEAPSEKINRSSLCAPILMIFLVVSCILKSNFGSFPALSAIPIPSNRGAEPVSSFTCCSSKMSLFCLKSPLRAWFSSRGPHVCLLDPFRSLVRHSLTAEKGGVSIVLEILVLVRIPQELVQRGSANKAYHPKAFHGPSASVILVWTVGYLNFLIRQPFRESLKRLRCWCHEGPYDALSRRIPCILGFRWVLIIHIVLTFAWKRIGVISIHFPN